MKFSLFILISIIDIIIGIIVNTFNTCDDDCASLYDFENDVIAIARPEINNDAATHIIRLNDMVIIFISKL